MAKAASRQRSRDSASARVAGRRVKALVEGREVLGCESEVEVIFGDGGWE